MKKASNTGSFFSVMFELNHEDTKYTKYTKITKLSILCVPSCLCVFVVKKNHNPKTISFLYSNFELPFKPILLLF